MEFSTWLLASDDDEGEVEGAGDGAHTGAGSGEDAGFAEVELEGEVEVAAEVELPAQMPDTRLTQRRLDRLDRATKMLLLAAREAWVESRWLPDARIPLVLGTTGGGMALGESYLAHAIRSPCSRNRALTASTSW